jgi:hypothetical protein
MSREPTALLLAAFLVTFVLTYGRLARVRGRGSASANGVHLHHMVVGIVLVLLSGLVEIALRPTGLGPDTIAVFFGGKLTLGVVGGSPTAHETFVPAMRMLAARLDAVPDE